MVKKKSKLGDKLNLSLALSCDHKILAPVGWFKGAKKIISKALSKRTVVEINVALVSAATIKKFNHRYRHQNKITDVLSFTYLNSKKYLQGDVVICLSVARRQAHELGHSLKEELNALLVHGALHLLGHDHHTIKETKAMMKAESMILGTKRRLVS